MTPQGRCIAPAGPPVLSAATVSGSLVTLSWTAPTTGGPVDSYVLGAGYSAGTLDAAIVETGTNALSVTVPAAFGRYFVRVAGQNPCGVGTPSNEVIVTVGPALPGPPAALAATLAPGGAVTISWNAPVSGDAPDSYVAGSGHRVRRLGHRHRRNAILYVPRNGHPRHLLRACARPERRRHRARVGRLEGGGSVSW